MAYRDVVLANSPLAYWRQGEPSGSTMNDETGVFDGSYDASSPPALGQTGLLTAPGETDTCAVYSFGDMAHVPDAAALRFTNGFTVEGWVRPESLAGNQRFIGKGVVGTSGWSAGVDGNNPAFYAMGVAAYVFSSVIVADFTPYHMVFVFEAATNDVRLIINGVDEGTVAGSSPCVTNTVDVNIASSDGIGELWVGAIDEVAVYDSELSVADAQAHYVAGTVGELQQFRPDADVTTTGWTTTPLWSKVDEDPASDADFITATAS